MKNKPPRKITTQNIIDTAISLRNKKRAKENMIFGWLFAGCIFLAGFIIGSLFF